MRNHPPFAPPLKEIRYAVSHALHTTLLPLTVLVFFLAAQGSILPTSACAESSSIYFNHFAL